MGQVKWGLMSTARINRSVIPAIRASRRGKITAIASRDSEKARSYATDWEIPDAYGSYGEMLDSDEVDAVYLNLPNHMHAQWSIRALGQGKHVLCEKPLALSVDEVDRMTLASRESKRVLAEAFMYRHHPQTKLIGEWVSSGRLGEISVVRSAFNFRLDDPEDIRLRPEYGGGSLWDLGIYPVSLAQFIIGSAPVSVAGQQLVGENQVDETFAGLLRYPGGEFAQVQSSFRTPEYQFADIQGTMGHLEIRTPFIDIDENSILLFRPNHGDPVQIKVAKKDLFLGEIEDMHAAILDGAPNLIGLDHSREHIRTVQSLYQSAQEGGIVELD